MINNGPQTVIFGQAGTSAGTSVQISAGAQINANSSDGSYVAIVAPKINNAGTINVSGNAALVAADAATITFQPSGLYSISIDVGTSATGTTLFSGGTITGSASSGAIAHQIYMMTAPKNTLINLLIGQGSNVGFDVAGAANVSGNSIILSGGYDVVGGSVNPSLAPKGGIGGSVNTNVTGSNVTSALTVISSNNAQVDAFNGGTTTLASDVTVMGYNTAFLGAFAAPSTLIANGNVHVQALDHGQSAAPGTSVTGGTAAIFANGGGSVALHGLFNTIDASASGATSLTAGVKAGDGTGGNAQIYAYAGGSITVDGQLFVSANGQGGSSRTDGVAGGNGQGGFVNALVSNTNASLTFKSTVIMSANGHGGTGTCITLCTGEAGTGQGGNAQVVAQQGTGTVAGGGPGGGSSIITLDPNATNTFSLSASGLGGAASNTNAGNATGGSVTISVDSGNALNFGSLFSAIAAGHGGTEDGTRLTGGNATGGNINVLLHPGASFTANAGFSIDASAFGGAGDPDSAGTGSSGGAATGGFARIFSDGGSGTFNGPVVVAADGFGGDSGSPGTTGAGGAGTGGSASIVVGSTTINTNNATLTFNGTFNDVEADGYGGTGYPGGLGTGGLAQVRTANGTISGNNLIVDSSGFGGDGARFGAGAGGNGVGGQSLVNARNNPFGPANVSFVNTDVISDGFGGNGGASFDPTVVAGAGGEGHSGNASATADSGDGSLTISGRFSGQADAFGGNGGKGASNATGAGGNGGAGGAACGETVDTAGNGFGGTQNGTVSGLIGTTANGRARFGSFDASGSATGGRGGAGGNFDTGGTAGNGGAGGAALDGFAGLLVRGSAVTIDGSAVVRADAIGGNGGSGAVDGTGGNATVGGIGGAFVAVTNRFQVPTQRASLNAGVITVSASAIGGTGSVAGRTTVDSSPLSLTVTNANVTATSLGIFSSAANVAANALPSVVQVSGGTVNLGSAFQFGSSGPITINLDTATLNAGFVGLSGSDWILPATPPVLAGTINATTGASFSSGNNIVTYANVNFSYPVGFNVIGNFQLGNVTAQGDFSSFSGGSTTFGSLAASNVDIRAGGPISVGAITTPGFVSLDNTVGSHSAAGVGNITVAAITAGRDLGVYSNGSVFATSPIQTGANVFVDALGSVTIGNVSAGLVNPSTVSGDTFEIAIRSGGPLVAGNLASRTDIGLVSAQTISTGTLTGQDMLLLGRGNVIFGAINASARVLIADATMAQLGGTFGGQFDKNAVFAGAPVRSAGSITINGAILASQSITAASQQGFTAGTMGTNNGPILVDAGAAIVTGNIDTSSNAVLHAGGAITTGTIDANNLLVLGGNAMSTQAINTSGGVIFADQSAYALGVTSGAYNIGAVFAGTAGSNLAAYRSPGAITVNGNVNSAGLRVATARSFTSGSITAPLGLLTSAGGPVTTGALLIGNGFTLQSDSDITTGAVDVGIGLATTDTNPSYFAAYNAGGNIVTGNIQTRNGVLLIAGGTATTGSLNTIDVLGLVHGAMSFGPISATGRVLLADRSMAAIGVTTTPPFFYDINLVYNAAPIASAGSITVNGATNAGRFAAATNSTFLSGAITTIASTIQITAGPSLVTGDLSAKDYIALGSSGTTSIGDITSSTLVDLVGIGATQTGSVTSSGEISIYTVGAIQTGNLSTLADIFLESRSAIATGTEVAGTSLDVIADGGFTSAALTAGRRVNIGYRQGVTSPTGAVTISGAIQAGAQVQISARSTLSTGNITAGAAPRSTVQGDFYDINLDAAGALSVGNLQTSAATILHSLATIQTGAINSGFLGILGGSSVNTGSINAGTTEIANQSFYTGQGTGPYNGQALINAVNAQPLLLPRVAVVGTPGSITINGSVNGGFFQALSTQDISVSGILNASQFAVLSALGNLTAGAVQAGNLVGLTAGQSLQVGDVTGGFGAGQPGLNVQLSAVGGTLTAGTIRAFNTAELIGTQTIQTGSITGTDVQVLGHGAITVGPIAASARALIADVSMVQLANTPTGGFDPSLIFAGVPVQSAGSITVNGTIQTGQFFTAATQQGFTSGAITTGTDLTINAGGAVLVGVINSGGFADISSGSLNTGPVTTRRYVRVRATGPVTVGGAIQAGAQVQLSSTASITAGNIAAGFAPQSTVTGDFYDINIDAGGALSVGNLQASQAAILHSLSTIQTGTISSNFFGALGGSSVNTGSINAGSSVFANQSFYAGQGTATYDGQALINAVNVQPIVVANVGTTGSISINGPVIGNALYAYSAQNIGVAGPVQESAIAILRAGGNIGAGSLQGGFGAQAIAGGNVQVGDVTGGMLTVPATSPAPVSGSTTTSVVLVSGGTLTAGNLRSFNNVLASSQQTIQTGSISTGDLLALGHGAISVGPITATGRVLMADVTMGALGNTTQTINGVTRPLFNPNLVFGATPVASAGPITINGSVSAASLTTASSGAFTSGALTATNFIDVNTGGNAQVNGAIQSGQETSIDAQGGITVGNVTAGPSGGTSDPIPFSIGLIANGGPLVAGNLSGTQSVGLASSGSITTGTLNGVNLLVGAGSTITTGAINMSGQALLASFAMLPLGGTVGGNGTYDARLVFAATPIAAPGAITIDGAGANAVVTNGFSAASQGLITINGNLFGTGSATLNAGNGVTLTNGVVGLPNGSFTLTGAGPVHLGDVTVGSPTSLGAIGIMSNGSVTTGFLGATNGVTASGGSALTLTGAFTNAGPVSLTSAGTINSGSVSTGTGALSVSAAGAIVTGNLGAGTALTVNGGSNVSLGTVRSSAGSVSLTAGGALNAGVINAATSVTLNAIGAMQTGSINAITQVSITADSFALATPTSPGTVVTISDGGALSISTVKALVLPSLTIGGNVALDSRTALTTGDITSNAGSVALSSGGSLTAGALKANTTLSLTAPGAITAGNATTFTGLTANGNITISGGDVTVLAGNSTNSKQALVITGTGALSLDTAFGVTSVALTAGTNLRTTGASATGTVTETAGGSIDTAQINAGGISINAGTTFQSGNLLSSKALTVTTGGNLATAALTANGGSATVNSGGTLNAGVINSTGGITVQSTGAATVQGLTSSGLISFISRSTFTNIGQTASAVKVIGQSTGAMTLGNVSASGTAGTIELASLQGSLTAGRISATTDVATIAAGGALTLTQATGRDILLLASTNVQVGAVTAGAVTNPTTGGITSATGRVLIANSSAGPVGGTFGNFNYNAVFNSTGGAVITNNPPRVGGTVTVTGTVNAGAFDSYSQGAMTGQVINAFGSLEVESGGLVTVGQRWTSPDLTILSNDIAIMPSQVLPTITTTAGLSSGTTGTVTLASLNANGAFVGDGLTAGQGYALSNAEVGLVQSGTLTIGAAAVPGLATTMTIGNLSLTGPQAGSNVDNQQSGAVQFVTGNPQTLVPSGTIRVTGAVTAKGFLTANQLQFETGTFELDTTGGSLTVTDSSNALAGGISISADRIHIAAASILDKLRVDPLYATRIVELNTAPTTPLANPVLSASQLIFAPTQTLYIQNTGTTAVPAGFLVPLAGLKIETPSLDTTQSTSRVSLVINGQFVGTSSTGGTGQGTTSPASITGATAFQQFIQQIKPTGLTADSQFNGCVIAAGSCGMAMTPTPDLSTQIQVLQTPALPSAPAIVQVTVQQSAEVTADPQQQDQTPDKPTEAEQKEEEKAQASARAPIAPPAPMIDTRPLSPPVSVDEPVAGGGNPALFGVGAAANQTEGGDK